MQAHSDLLFSELSRVHVDNVVDERVCYKVGEVEYHFVGFEFGCPNHLKRDKLSINGNIT